MLTRISLDGSEPITLADAKAHLRVTDSAEDTLITALITTARERVEGRTGRALRQATWELRLDAFDLVIVLPLPPLSSVTSVKYIDTAGVEQTISPSDYVVSAPVGPAPQFGTIWPAFDKSWPTPRAEREAVRVRFVAGGSVPSSLTTAMLLILGELYANREASIAAPGTSMNPALAALTDDYRVTWVG